MDREGKLTIKDLMNFIYCKRLIYFENILKVPQATTLKQLKGRELHNIFTRKSKRTKLMDGFENLVKQYSLPLESKRLHFRTVLDCLLIDRVNNCAYPIQYKFAKKPERLYKTLRMQMFAESFLVEEVLCYSVPAAFIRFELSDDIVRVPVDAGSLSEVEHTLEEIHKTIQNETVPEPTPFIKKCTDCCYNRLCKRA